MSTQTKPQARLRRRRRVRAKVRGSAERPRLSVFRSNRGLFAQLVDDDRGHTLVAVAFARRSAARPSARACRCSAPTAASRRS